MTSSRFASLTDEELRWIDAECEEFEKALPADGPSGIETRITSAPEQLRDSLFLELLAIELEYRATSGPSPDLSEYEARFCGRESQTRSVFRRVCGGGQECATSEAATALDDSADGEPKYIGRYRVKRVLGQGGFGLVYEAHDENLERSVAIKVPHTRLVPGPADAQVYLDEARTVAGLDHAHIVPVYDVGGNDVHPCYVVSKYIDGTSLATRLKEGGLSQRSTAELIACVADALHHAHRRGLVHRDVKPGNILLDRTGSPHLGDFGLALREEEVGYGPKYAGTPAYMSPEQARGEGHRVDGRSDVFSLGVVLYELLAGRPPFRGKSNADLMDRIATWDPRPPRQFDETVPRELERICLKALAKKAGKRYSSAHDMAAELRQFLAETSPTGLTENSSPRSVSPPRATETAFLSSSDRAFAIDSDSQPIRVVPKGLRSFDRSDADFFLELVAGPRGRDGLPESVRFWKTRIEDFDSDDTFSVGLIYGPSGCGKSSLVKAGLLPRLSSRIVTVHIECTEDQTESRLLRGLRKVCPDMPSEGGLKESLTVVRQGHALAPDQKVLIVLDQFEQWLHARRDEDNTELMQALRQCDGGRVQCLMTVRDDFWLAISRFMGDLEVDLVPGSNIAIADLFSPDHARRVLAAFGRAFERLPANPRDTSAEETRFLDCVVRELAVEGRIVCVRLALFAEMMKDKPWTLASLRDVGGAQGVGVTFLEETFSTRTANPTHRLHQSAARSVLSALLPESDTDIKGRMRSEDELRRASGYGGRERAFADLVRILDHEVRLITPTQAVDEEPLEDPATAEGGGRAEQPDVRHYQLAHDYLVPALRDWLTRKRRETRRGRAELRLERQARMWHGRRESRHLPLWWEYAGIRVHTRTANWTEPQRQMMQAAGRWHGLRWVIGLLVAVAIGIGIQQFVAGVRHRNLTDQARAAVAGVGTSRGNAVPHAIRDLRRFPSKVIRPELRTQSTSSHGDQKLALSFALAEYGMGDVQELIDSIESAPVREVANIVAALRQSQTQALPAVLAAASAAGDDLSALSRYAIVAIHLGDGTLAAEMCRLRPDPIQQMVFVEQLSRWPGDLGELAARASAIDDYEVRAAVCMGIGGVATEHLTEGVRSAWYPVLSTWYQHAPEKLLHSAAGWVLRQWDLALPELPSRTNAAEQFEWYVNESGLTMLVIPPGTFESRENTFGHETAPTEIRITKPFAVSDREVSLALYRQAIDDESSDIERPFLHPWQQPDTPRPRDSFWPGEDSHVSPTPAHPVQNVSWIEAVMFCNWLSRKEGLEPCYERTGRVWQIPTGEFEEWRRVPDRDGYRLPTDAEWEYVCRAGTTTTFCFGDEDRFRRQFAVLHGTRALPCGSLLPNNWGLFDIHGNVGEWCQDWHPGFRGQRDDTVDPSGPRGHKELCKTMRGGGFTFSAYNARTAAVFAVVNVRRSRDQGFRVARSLSHSR